MEVEVAYHCPSCKVLVRVWQPVSPYYLLTGPCLICPTCAAVIAVHLEVVIPGTRRVG
jgi:hypothetical protein